MDSTQRFSTDGRRAVAIWLWLVAASLLAMIVLGGVVRLTGSGLSITVWAPIVGTLPPLDHAAWERAFALYQQSPEFRFVNAGISLEGFKSIFWFEYFHRLLGRSIGAMVALPLLFFAWRGYLKKKLVRGLLLLLLLGGLQGFVGWYMVASGLVDEARVNHLRLTLHLGMGLGIFAYTVWLAIEQTFGGDIARQGSRALGRVTAVVTALVSFTALSGGLVAGLKAGHAFPTFPLMAGKLVPDGLFASQPAWQNSFDNALTVNFQHRVLATLVLLVVAALFWHSRRVELPRHARLGFSLMLLFVLLQVTLGISTLLLDVPVALAAAHQGNAALLLATTLYANYAIRHAPFKLESLESAPAPNGAVAQA